MSNITIRISKTVKIAAPEWFREPEFQAWYNTRLGRDLATWQDAQHPLSSDVRLSASECAEHAQVITEAVWQADIWITPNKGDPDTFDAEIDALKDARMILANLILKLEAASKDNGLDIDTIKSLRPDLRKVMESDVFMEPKYEFEQITHTKAMDALEALEDTLLIRTQRTAALSGDSLPDVFVTVEPQSAEGIHSDMPERYWDVVVREAHKVADGTEDCQIVVWISPL
ncbi:MAG: hypothetical protein AWU57_553 [Marinobacter sp. T13-3]|nr:MAG: hypothetical protein AWU57_553 [Marinobacter sp. T13-3]